MKIKFRTMNLFFYLLCYKILLDISYITIITPNYSYYMDLTLEINYIRLIESYIMLIFLFMFTPLIENNIVNIYLMIQLLLMLVPMLSLYGLSSRSRIFSYAVCICHIIQCLLGRKVISRKKEIKYQHYNLIFWGTVIGLSVFTMSFILYKFGMPDLSALNFEKVYDIREEHQLVFPISYFMPWLAGVIMPLLFIWGIDNKKYIIIISAIFCEGILYLVFANKSHLFTFFLVTIVYLAKKTNKLTEVMFKGFPSIVLLSTIVYYVDNRFLIVPSLFIRRVLFLPAVLKFKYYDFFSSNNKLYFADGIIGKILGIDSTYSDEAPLLIAKYVGQPQSSCNTGYLGDAYANLGIFGMVMFSLVLLYIIKYIDKCTNRLDLALVCGISVYSFYALNDGALLTRLLTGGLILLIFLLDLLNMNKNKMKGKNKKYVWHCRNSRLKKAS